MESNTTFQMFRANESTMLESGSSCTLWIDRHVHKTGGTTIRAVMQLLQSAGLAQHATGWSLRSAPALVDFIDELRGLVSPCSPSLRHMIIAVEAHEGANLFSPAALEAIRTLRAEPGACCRPYITSRTREPLSHYISTWLWGGATVYSPFGRTLETWAPRNLQSVLMRDGNPHRWVEGAKRWTNQTTGLSRSRYSFDTADLGRLLGILDNDVDLVWPLSRMEEGLSGFRLNFWKSGFVTPTLLCVFMAPIRPVYVRGWVGRVHTAFYPS